MSRMMRLWSKSSQTCSCRTPALSGWLFRGLSRSDSRWNVIGQQVPVTRLDVGGPGEPEYKLDKWDAYPVARERLLRFLHDARIRIQSLPPVISTMPGPRVRD